MTGAELYEARIALGKTQGGLAAELGVGRRTIQQYEAGDRRVPELVAKVMRASLIDPSILEQIAEA